MQHSFQQFVTAIDLKAAVIQLPDKHVPQLGKKWNNNNYSANSISKVKGH